MGDPAPLKKGTQPPLFSPCLLWPNNHPSRLLLSTCLVPCGATGGVTVAQSISRYDFVQGDETWLWLLCLLEQCNPWPHVANHHMSISQLLSSCCHLFMLLNSGLLFYTEHVSTTSTTPSQPICCRHIAAHRHIPELICEINSSIDFGLCVRYVVAC